MSKAVSTLLCSIALAIAGGSWIGSSSSLTMGGRHEAGLIENQTAFTKRPASGIPRAPAAGGPDAASPKRIRFPEFSRIPKSLVSTDNWTETLYYHENAPYTAFGRMGAGLYIPSIRFTTTAPCSVKAARFYMAGNTARSGTVYLRAAGSPTTPGAVLATAPWSANTQGWVSVSFPSTPPRPAGADFWVCVSYNQPGDDYWIVVDDGPKVPGRNFRSFDNSTWGEFTSNYNYFIDAIKVNMPFDNDMSAVSINGLPTTTRPNQWLPVRATVKNVGNLSRPAGVPVILSVSSGAYFYSDTVYTTLTLTTGQSEQVTFDPPWRTPATVGMDTVRVWTNLASDMSRANDTTSQLVEVTNWLNYANWARSFYVYTFNASYPEGGTYFAPDEFGVVMPVTVDSLKARFYFDPALPWTDTSFVFKVWDSTGTVLLYTSPVLEAPVPSSGYFSTCLHAVTPPVTVPSAGYLVTIDPVTDGAGPQPVSDDSYQGYSYLWETASSAWVMNFDGSVGGEFHIQSFVSWAPAAHDVGFTAISLPGNYVEPGSTVIPTGTIRNYGPVAEPTVLCSCFVEDTLTDNIVYSGEATASLGLGGSASVTFPGWTVPSGDNIYLVTMKTALAGDGNAVNDARYYYFSAFHVNNPLTAPYRAGVTLDGVLSPGEWDNANRYDISNVIGWAGASRYAPTVVWMSVKHDNQYLYIGIDAPFETVDDSLEVGLYFDDDADGLWADDSSEGNYWAVHWGTTDTVYYRPILPGGASTQYLATGARTRSSTSAGHTQMEIQIPFGAAKGSLNADYHGATVGLWTFALDDETGDWFGWWLTTMDDANALDPSYYGQLELAAAPAAPTLVAPWHLSATSNQRPTFTWTGNTGDDMYQLQVSTSASFPGPCAVDIQQPGLNFTPSSDLAESHYFWHVRASTDGGESWSDFTPTWEFDIDITPPAPPTLTYPGPNAVGIPLRPTFTWTEVTFKGKPALGPRKVVLADAVHHYDIQVATDAGFTALVLDEDPTSATYAMTTDLSSLTRYHWRVRGVDQAMNEGSWATDSFATVVPAPSAPILVLPADNASGVPVNGDLVWRTATGAEEYDVYLDNVTPPASLVAPGQLAPDTTFSYSALGGGADYYWQIVARNQGGDAPSAIFHFTTEVAAPARPELASPESAAVDVPTSGTLTWLPAAGADNYDVYLGVGNPPALFAANITGTSLAYANLFGDRDYFWRVCAKNGTGTTFSSIWPFTTAAAPPTPGGWTLRPDTMPSPQVKDGGGLCYNGDVSRIYAIKGNKTDDFYQYTPPDTTWKRLTSVTAGDKAVGKGAAITTGAGFVFVMKGNNTRGFYKFDIAESTWIKAKDIPLALDQTATRGKAVKAGGGLAYVNKNDTAEYVYTLKGYGTDFYKYDIARDTFYSLTAAPYTSKPKYDKGSWICYDGTRYIYAMQPKYNALYRYDITSESWDGAVLDGMPFNSTVTGKSNKKVGDGSCAAWNPDGGYLFAMKGNGTQEAWKYLPGTDGDTWIELESIPQAYSGGKKKKVKSGGGTAYYPETGVFYVQKGNKSNQFVVYRPGTGVADAVRPHQDGVACLPARGAGPGIGIEVMPNPLASGYATIRYSLPKAGTATLSVSDVTGRVVMTRTLAASRTGAAGLDLRGLSAGVYLVKLSADGYTTSQKLVVER